MKRSRLTPAIAVAISAQLSAACSPSKPPTAPSLSEGASFKVCAPANEMDRRYGNLRSVDDRLEADIRKFLGDTTNPMSKDAGPVWQQAIEQIAVPAETFSNRLPNGRWLLAGSRYDNGTSRTAVLINCEGEIGAVGITVPLNDHKGNFYDELWIYVDSTPDGQSYIDDLKNWSGTGGLRAVVTQMRGSNIH